MTSDREQIRDLFARLAHHLDRGDAERYADCYTEDGTFRATGVPAAPAEGVVQTGRAALMDFVHIAARHDKGGTRHWNDMLVFTELTGDHATIESYMVQFRAGISPQAEVAMTGVYHDRLVKRDGRWLMYDRHIVIDRVSQPACS